MPMWNPWHGCTKVSPACKNCYVYRRDAEFHKDASVVTRTASFALPVKKNRRGEYKLKPEDGAVMTCFSSDFFHEAADAWRPEAWAMMKERSDLEFFFITKRPERFFEGLPEDWGEGYGNVHIGCTCENQDRADFRLPIFAGLPIRHKTVILGPMLGPVNLEKYLDGSISEVACSGESGINVRPLDYEWVLDVRRQCMNKGVPFQFHQTGAYFIKDGRMYHIPRRFQTSQARKAGIDYKIVNGFIPDFQAKDIGTDMKTLYKTKDK